MMGVSGIRRAGLFAVLLLTPLFAFAAELATAKKGEYVTFVGSSFGKLAITVDDKSGFIGTFDKGGKLTTKISMEREQWEGTGAPPRLPEESDSKKNGISYWGKVIFKVSDDGKNMTGKWGSCDAAPDTEFKAKWDGNWCLRRAPSSRVTAGRLSPLWPNPRPTNGIFVAITVMNSTLASSGRLAM